MGRSRVHYAHARRSAGGVGGVLLLHPEFIELLAFGSSKRQARTFLPYPTLQRSRSEHLNTHDNVHSRHHGPAKQQTALHTNSQSFR